MWRSSCTWAARHVLQRHTAASLAAARDTNRALSLLPDHQVTHYVPEIRLPADAAQLLFVTTPSRVAGAKLPTLLLTKIHIPKAAYRRAVSRRYARGPAFHKPHPALLMAGVQDSGSDPNLPPDVHDWLSAFDAAVSIVFQHAELLNIGPDTAGTVTDIITFANGISDLATQIFNQVQDHQQNPSAENWVLQKPYTKRDGDPDKWRYVWSDTTQDWMAGPMKDSLRQTKNDPLLQSSSDVAGCYTVQHGVTALGSPQGGDVPQLRGVHLAAARPRRLGEGGPSWTVNDYTPQHGFTYNGDVELKGGTFSASFTNSWLRWLSGYVEFLGPDNSTPVVPDGWSSQVPPGVAGTYDSDRKKFVTLFSAVDTILGIPLAGSPTEISFAWPPNAAGVRILAGGIGRTGGIQGEDGKYYGGWDAQVCAAGAIMTGIFNYGIPMIILAAGTGVPETSSLSKLAKSVLPIALDLGQALVNGPIANALSHGEMLSVLIAFADAVPHMLLESPELAAAIAAEVATEEAIEDSTPVIGWIALGLSILATLANLVQTSVEVGLSPAVFELKATRAIDAKWTLQPDQGHKQWPLEARHYVVTATFTDGTTRIATGTVPPGQETDVTVVFDQAAGNQLPAGDKVTFAAAIYSDTDWICGTADSGPWAAAIEADTLIVPTQAITEKVVPLQADTQYLYFNSLAFDAAKGRHVWAEARPQATIDSLNPSPIGSHIGKLGQITVNQPQNQLGYSWQASGQGIPLGTGGGPSNALMYSFQTVSTLSDPEAGLRFVPSGFTASAPIAYDLTGEPQGNHFYVDPTDALFHLRKIALDGSTGRLSPPTRSWAVSMSRSTPALSILRVSRSA